MKINAIITGSTGMVGEGVLHECLNHPNVESVLVINRNSIDIQHPKLKEILHQDFLDFTTIKHELSGYNAAFLCMGTTSFMVKEDVYSRITYDMTLALAEPLARLNPELTLCYVSGMGTDGSETGRTMWTRVKGRTENALLALPVKAAYMFRPGFIQPTPGLNSAHTFYKLIKPLNPLLKLIFPKVVGTLRDLGTAMINTVDKGYDKNVLEVKDINKLANL